jgi:hypothetical protein
VAEYQPERVAFRVAVKFAFGFPVQLAVQFRFPVQLRISI